MSAMEQMEVVQNNETIKRGDKSTKERIPRGIGTSRDKWELVTPDGVDYMAMGVVAVIEYFILLFMALRTANPFILLRNFLGFESGLISISDFLAYQGTYIYYATLYLAYWCWRWGYHSVYHMSSLAKQRAEKLMKNGGMTWDMKFFGLIFSIAMFMLADDLAELFSVIL